MTALSSSLRVAPCPEPKRLPPLNPLRVQPLPVRWIFFSSDRVRETDFNVSADDQRFAYQLKFCHAVHGCSLFQVHDPVARNSE